MPSTHLEFTDQNLKWLYGNLLNHYQELVAQRLPINSVYTQMYGAVQQTVDWGFLSQLPHEEKAKVYNAFHAIFYALPLYGELPNKQTFQPVAPKPTLGAQGKSYTNTLAFNWLLLSSITQSCQHRTYSSYDGGWSSGRHHSHSQGNHHRHQDKKDSKTAELLAALFLLLLAASAAVLAALAVYYMLREFLNGAERFYYNEGWLKAALMAASAVAFGSAVSLLSFTVLAAPLTSLALMAGLNPVGVVIAGGILLTLIGAGIGSFAMDLLYGKIESKYSSDAIDPEDPLRFRVTKQEEAKLLAAQIDPIKVKCAIVALRVEMARVLENEKPIPSFLSRKFGAGAKIQDLLNQVRKLRQGEISTVEVGNLYFDCRNYNASYQHTVHNNPVFDTPLYNPYYCEPSAPPM